MEYDIYLNGKIIDTISYMIRITNKEVKKSLVNHDGYDSNIVIRKRRNKKVANPDS